MVGLTPGQIIKRNRRYRPAMKKVDFLGRGQFKSKVILFGRGGDNVFQRHLKFKRKMNKILHCETLRFEDIRNLFQGH